MKVSGFLWDDCDFTCDYDLLKELGIDYPYIAYDESMYKTLVGLDLAKEHNMQIIVTAWPFWTYFKTAPNYLTTTTKEYIQRLLTHESLHSIYIWDEPPMGRLSEITRLVTKTREWIQSLNSDKKLFINLFPNYATDQQLGTSDYHEYVETFVPLSDIVSGDFFFVRNYNDKTEINNVEHFPNSRISTERLYIFLRELFDASKKYNKPLWLWMVTNRHNQFAHLDLVSIRLQFNIGYIVGAEQMNCWTLREPIASEISDSAQYYEGPIHRDYTKGESFEDFKYYLNEVAPYLNDIFDNCTVIDFGKVDSDTPTINEDVPFDSGNNNIYWNKMEDNEGYKYWTVMNFHDTNIINIKVKNDYIFYNKEFEEELVKDLYQEVELIPGELLIIKTPVPQSFTNMSLHDLNKNYQNIVNHYINKNHNNLYLIENANNLMDELSQSLDTINSDIQNIEFPEELISSLSDSIDEISIQVTNIENSYSNMNNINDSLVGISERLTTIENNYSNVQNSLQVINIKLNELELEEPSQNPIEG